MTNQQRIEVRLIFDVAFADGHPTPAEFAAHVADRVRNRTAGELWGWSGRNYENDFERLALRALAALIKKSMPHELLDEIDVAAGTAQDDGAK